MRFKGTRTEGFLFVYFRFVTIDGIFTQYTDYSEMGSENIWISGIDDALSIVKLSENEGKILR